jgi:multiple sugar transport system ATP-binding protein
VALGRAIVRDPKVYLWDEPLSNLDAKLRVEMRSELRKLQRRLKVTTIHVTHDQVEAMTMADRVAVMKDGSIRQFGTPHEVYAHPRDEFVGGFIGSPSMNFYDCTLEERNGDPVLDAGDFLFHVPREFKGILLKNTTNPEVRLGVRPEDIRISQDKDPNAIEAKVDLVEPIGSYVLVYLTMGRSSAIMRADPKFSGRIGDRITVTFAPSKIHIFDRATTQAII